MTQLNLKRIEFLKASDLNDLSPVEGFEKEFSLFGCECCDDGLANDVVECAGYSEKHKTVFDGIKLCWGCVCFFANGE